LEEQQNWTFSCENEWGWSHRSDDGEWGQAQEEHVSSPRSNSALEKIATSTFFGMALFFSALIPPIKGSKTFPFSSPDEVSSVIVGLRRDQQTLSATRNELVSQTQSVASSTPEILFFSSRTEEMEDVWPEFEEFDDSRDLLWKECSTCKTPSNQELQIEQVISFRVRDVSSIRGRLDRAHKKFREENPPKSKGNSKHISEAFRKQRNLMDSTSSNYKKEDPSSEKSKKLFEELKQGRVKSIQMLKDIDYKSVFNGKKLKKGKPKNFFS
jgi:hypothetical protein